jgi:hypothetical protein
MRNQQTPHELTDAILVNPFYEEDLAESMRAAMLMPRARAKKTHANDARDCSGKQYSPMDGRNHFHTPRFRGVRLGSRSC